MTYKSLETTIRTLYVEEKDYEGEMARSELKTLADRANELASMIKDDDQLEAWVQSKITKAEDYINSVYDYLMTQKGEQK